MLQLAVNTDRSVLYFLRVLQTMKIGIIGSGNMGRSLGILWAEQGHEVFFGARTAEKGKDIAELDKTPKEELTMKRLRLLKSCYTQCEG